MWMNLLWLAAGFVLLIVGGETLVRGSVGLARAMGISTLVVGLTVVAFGTSAPELAVNVQAALRGEGDISFGNIIGSNIANLGLILGVTALVRAVRVHSSIITREIPIMLLATALVIFMALDQPLGLGDVNTFSRANGVILLGLFAAFIAYTTAIALRQRTASKADALVKDLEEEKQEEKPLAVGPAVALTIFGLFAVVLGGDLTVKGAVGVAEAFGISKAVIGLTIVAIGTSLPELATCVTAALRNHTDIAIGNVVGSNIWNLLLILAVTATINPLGVPSGGVGDLAVMGVLSIAVLPLVLIGPRQLARVEGIALV
ncbi:MAG: calcium/sodium antiporter, partial [Phycisphaerae bacterium]|nr:calcium/sodium antiporter [Phycisphaerae bacterium]